MQTLNERNEANVQAAIAGRKRLDNIHSDFWYAPATGSQPPAVSEETAPTDEELAAQVAQMTTAEYAESRAQMNPAAAGKPVSAEAQMSVPNPRIPDRNRYMI
jgi:hypothetical protein